MKKTLLLILSAVFFLNIQFASAGDDSIEIKTTTGDEECVITDDL